MSANTAAVENIICIIIITNTYSTTYALGARTVVRVANEQQRLSSRNAVLGVGEEQTRKKLADVLECEEQRPIAKQTQERSAQIDVTPSALT